MVACINQGLGWVVPFRELFKTDKFALEIPVIDRGYNISDQTPTV